MDYLSVTSFHFVEEFRIKIGDGPRLFLGLLSLGFFQRIGSSSCHFSFKASDSAVVSPPLHALTQLLIERILS
jgi:hypothetical protein